MEFKMDGVSSGKYRDLIELFLGNYIYYIYCIYFMYFIYYPWLNIQNKFSMWILLLPWILSSFFILFWALKFNLWAIKWNSMQAFPNGCIILRLNSLGKLEYWWQCGIRSCQPHQLHLFLSDSWFLESLEVRQAWFSTCHSCGSRQLCWE